MLQVLFLLVETEITFFLLVEIRRKLLKSNLVPANENGF